MDKDVGVTGNSFSYIVGPIIAFAGLGLLVILLRWTFKRGGSLIAAPAQQGDPQQYGLLIPVAQPGTYIEGEMLRHSLEDAGVKATLTQTLDGPRIMVWPKDEARARGLIQGQR